MLQINYLFQYFLAPELQGVVSSLEKHQNFSRTSTPQHETYRIFLFKENKCLLCILINDDNLEIIKHYFINSF